MNTTNYLDQLNFRLNMYVSQHKQSSIRSIAKKVGMSHTLLSLITKGKRKLTYANASQLADVLFENMIERQNFLKLVESDASLNRKYKDKKLKSLQISNIVHPTKFLNIEEFNLVSDWYYFVIIELTEVYQNLTAELTASYLSIPVSKANNAIKILLDKGLIIQTDTGFQKTNITYGVKSPIPAKTIRNFHRQMIDKAKTAINDQLVPNRYMSGMIFAVNKEHLPLITQKIEAFKEEINALLSEKKSNAVYQMNVQLFELTNTCEKSN